MQKNKKVKFTAKQKPICFLKSQNLNSLQRGKNKSAEK